MQLLTDTSITRNINYYATICRTFNADITDSEIKGVGANELGRSDENQRIAFGLDPAVDTDADSNEEIQLPIIQLSQAHYSQTEISNSTTRTGESLADEALLDALDSILTYGLLKEKYPYDATDNDDPNVAGIDELLKNPRECIIDALTAYSNPWNSDPTLAQSIRDKKTREAIWLITFTPEFMIRK